MGSCPSQRTRKVDVQMSRRGSRSDPRRAEDPSPAKPAAEIKRHAEGHLNWPLPPSERYPPFQVNDNSGSERFSLPPLSARSETSPIPPRTNAKSEELHNERQTDGEAWKKESDSQMADSAHVQTQLSGRFHACFNLSTVDHINIMLNSLKTSQNDLDVRVKNRLTKISKAAQDKITLAVDATKKDQQALLMYDKDRQRYLQEKYQEWLQKYVVELNKWMANELARLQGELKTHQDSIVASSERRINRISTEADRLKKQIVQEEQDAERRRIARLTDTMYKISRDDGQFLNSESKTELNLRIQANVGQVAPGQGCPNDFP